MVFTDTHAHLHFPDYANDLAATLERAQEKGVKYLINVGTNLECSRKAVRLAEETENMYASIGCHPHDAKDFKEADYGEFERLAGHPKVVAIGEVGLDFYRHLSPQEIQETVFRRFLGLHQETGLPLILHVRDAHARTFEILEEEIGSPVRGVLHCFSGDSAVLEKALSMDLWISFAGNVTYKKNQALRALIPQVRMNKILIETDSPFLPPEGWRGKRNEPSYLIEAASLLSSALEVSLQEIGSLTSRNAAALFGFPVKI